MRTRRRAKMKRLIAIMTSAIFALSAHAADETDYGWIMHRIDPPLGNQRYGGYNSLAPADFNKDGCEDYVVIHEFLGWIGATILFHPGLEGKKVYGPWEKVEVYQGKHVEHAQVGDFDNDGNTDILIVEGSEHGGSSQTSILWGPSAQQVKDPKQWTRMNLGNFGTKKSNALYASVCDIDNDGDLDAFVGGRGSNHKLNRDQEFYGIRWAECPNTDPRKASNWKTHVIDPELLSGHGHIFIDINSDGYKDIVVNNADFNTGPDDRALLWYENPGKDNIHQPWTKHTIHKDKDYFMKCGLDAGDLDGDGRIDIVIPLGYDKILRFEKTSNDPVTFEHSEIIKPLKIQQVQRPTYIRDVNQDGKMDLVGGQLHYAYHTRYGNPVGYFHPDKDSIFWMSYEGEQPGSDNWKAHTIKKAFGSNTGRGAQGEKMDNVLLVDIDRDGDLDAIANSEESFVRLNGKVNTFYGVAWFENVGVTKVASDNFESKSNKGGFGWKQAWVTNQAAQFSSDAALVGQVSLELSPGGVAERTLSHALEAGQLDFKWMSSGSPEKYSAEKKLTVEAYNGHKWVALSYLHPRAREESLPYKNEMLSLSALGKVTKLRFSLTGNIFKVRIDDIFIRESVD